MSQFQNETDYWSQNEPNALNDYDDGLSPVWINHPAKAEILVQTSSVRVYKRVDHMRNAWVAPDWINWA